MLCTECREAAAWTIPSTVAVWTIPSRVRELLQLLACELSKFKADSRDLGQTWQPKIETETRDLVKEASEVKTLLMILIVPALESSAQELEFAEARKTNVPKAEGPLQGPTRQLPESREVERGEGVGLWDWDGAASRKFRNQVLQPRFYWVEDIAEQ